MSEVVFVWGCPGSGKGTQCVKIAEEFGYVHISAGELLRAEQNTPGSKYSEILAKCMPKCSVVPYEITCSLLVNAIDKHILNAIEIGDAEFGCGKFLIDGFPTDMDNLKCWEKRTIGKVFVKFVMLFDCADQICLERCLKRGRSNDNIETMKKRIDFYLNETIHVIKHYDVLHSIRRIDASLSPEEVYNNVRILFLQ